MPTISQLPAASPVSASDILPISQGGSVCAVSVGELLLSAQPVITVPSPVLLGRTSLGSGGPEQVNVGLGLALSQGTVAANGADHATFPPATTLVAGADLVISNQGTQMLMTADLLRGLFSAGPNITIDPTGVISSSVEGTLAPTALLGSAIGALEVVTSVVASDLVAVSQSGGDHAISYQNFLSGMTIEQAPLAAAVSNSDALWVAQGSNVMASQTFGAIWQWITQQFPLYSSPVLELTVNSALETALHNGCVLVCSQPITIAVSTTGLANGFSCRVINLSSGNVTFGPGFVTASGGSVVEPLQAAVVQCLTYSAGTVVYVAVPAGSTALSVPGQAVGLTAASVNLNSVTLTWEMPTAGGAPAAYNVQYRVTGAAAWSSGMSALSATTCQISGLQAGVSYDFEVQALNASGTGPFSAILTILTTAASAAATSAPTQVTDMTAIAASSTDVTLTWPVQTGTDAASTYTAQYRVTGTAAWNVSAVGITGTSFEITALEPMTGYDFSVVGVNSVGSGPISNIVSLTMPALTVPVPAAISGISGTAQSSASILVSWTEQSGTGAATSYTLQYRLSGTTAWSSLVPGIVGSSYTVSGLQAGTSYDFSVFGVNGSGAGSASSSVSVATGAAGTSVSSITWNVSPSGNYSLGSNTIGINAHVTPASAVVQFGFSPSVTTPPASWMVGSLVNTNLWGAYVPTPATAGSYYAWVEGIDGSCPTVFPTSFSVQ